MTKKEFVQLLRDFHRLAPEAQADVVDALSEGTPPGEERLEATKVFFENLVDHCSDLSVAAAANGALIGLSKTIFPW